MARHVKGARPSDRRLLFRFVVGAVDLGRERLLAELRASAPAAPDPARRATTPHPLLGAILLVPVALDVATQAARRLYARGPGRVIDRSWRRLRTTRTGLRVVRRVDDTRAEARDLLARWGELGGAEAAAGRRLAEVTLGRIYTGALANLADSHELVQLIQEGSAGLTRGVVHELRERSEHADARAEHLVRRLRRRAR